MKNKWLIFFIIIIMYMPVSIDATVLHVAVPRLSVALEASNNELLWIIDIYSLTMAGLLLPMGALGDRIGFKRLALIGLVIFGFASLGAALAPSAQILIIARALLGAGAAMILPATLAGTRRIFPDRQERDFAIGIWVAVGTGGAMIGPLVGGFLLEHFYWGSVFLINLPIVVLTIALTGYLVPKQPVQSQQPLYIGQALILTSSLLILIFVAKNIMSENVNYISLILMAALGCGLFAYFVRQQLSMPIPMIDIRLFKNNAMRLGVTIAIAAMIAMIGFELLMAQELQFVIDKTPLQAALFMLPLMIASGICGPLAGKISALFGIRVVAILGMIMSTVSFLGLSATHFATQPILAWLWMIILGLGASAAFFAATSTIMASAPVERATAAGAIEGMAYELGAGFGITVFGVMLAGLYTSGIELPQGLTVEQAYYASASISEAMQVMPELDESTGMALVTAAKQAFSVAHSIVLKIAGVIFALLTLLVWRYMPAK